MSAKQPHKERILELVRTGSLHISKLRHARNVNYRTLGRVLEQVIKVPTLDHRIIVNAGSIGNCGGF